MFMFREVIINDSLGNVFPVIFKVIGMALFRSSHPEVFLRKHVLKICSKLTKEHPFGSVISIKLQSIALRHGCYSVNLLHTLLKKSLNFIKKESLTQVFSCEFCGISKNTFLNRTPRVAASQSKSIGI